MKTVHLLKKIRRLQENNLFPRCKVCLGRWKAQLLLVCHFLHPANIRETEQSMEVLAWHRVPELRERCPAAGLGDPQRSCAALTLAGEQGTGACQQGAEDAAARRAHPVLPQWSKQKHGAFGGQKMISLFLLLALDRGEINLLQLVIEKFVQPTPCGVNRCRRRGGDVGLSTTYRATGRALWHGTASVILGARQNLPKGF